MPLLWGAELFVTHWTVFWDSTPQGHADMMMVSMYTNILMRIDIMPVCGLSSVMLL